LVSISIADCPSPIWTFEGLKALVEAGFCGIVSPPESGVIETVSFEPMWIAPPAMRMKPLADTLVVELSVPSSSTAPLLVLDSEM